MGTRPIVMTYERKGAFKAVVGLQISWFSTATHGGGGTSKRSRKKIYVS